MATRKGWVPSHFSGIKAGGQEKSNQQANGSEKQSKYDAFDEAGRHKLSIQIKIADCWRLELNPVPLNNKNVNDQDFPKPYDN